MRDAPEPLRTSDRLPGRIGGRGRLAQRESAAFTRQRSLVRSQYRPLLKVRSKTIFGRSVAERAFKSEWACSTGSSGNLENRGEVGGFEAVCSILIKAREQMPAGVERNCDGAVARPALDDFWVHVLGDHHPAVSQIAKPQRANPARSRPEAKRVGGNCSVEALHRRVRRIPAQDESSTSLGALAAGD
jgi:hypothetical protein